MAFTDVEMAILSQCAYCRYPDGVDKESLYRFLIKNRAYLERKLGSSYLQSLDALIRKVKDKPYTIVQTQDDRDGTGFAAFAVVDPNNEVTVACRGTEFDKLLSPKEKEAISILENKRITGALLRNSQTVKTALLQSGFFGDEADECIDDFIADFQLTLLKETEQQEQMANFVAILEDTGDYNGYYFTGHSLGGNLATYGAIVLRDKSKLKEAVTFNAPGFNKIFWEENADAIKQVTPNIRSFQNERDAISECMKVPGNIIIIDCQDDNAGGMKAHGLGQLTLLGTDNFALEPDGKKERTAWGAVFSTGSTLFENVSYGWYRITQSVKNTFDSYVCVPVFELQECARKLQAYADDSADIFDRIYNSLNLLKTNKQWNGLVVDAIIAATQQNRRTFEETLEELQALANFMKKFANEMEEKDKDIARQIAAL